MGAKMPNQKTKQEAIEQLDVVYFELAKAKRLLKESGASGEDVKEIQVLATKLIEKIAYINLENE